MSLAEYKNKLSASQNVKWSAEATLEFLWSFEVLGKVENIWTYLADTSSFNREIDFAQREQSEKNGKQYVKTTALGVTQEWFEEPWMWIAGKTISVERKYIKGFAKSVQIVFHIIPNEQNTKAQVYIYFGWRPKNKFCEWFLRITENPIKNKFAHAFKKIEIFLQNNQNVKGVEAFRKINRGLNLAQKNRLNELTQKLLQKKLNREIVLKISEYIQTADDLELSALRVIQLAHDWGFNYKDILRVCLHGARAGLFNISWNVMCPHCRGARFSAANLGEIPSDSNCEVCNIEFSTDKKNAIEVVFKIHNSVRKVSEVVYCTAEPARKNHIKIQQKIESLQKLKLALPFLTGAYRIRCNEFNICKIIKIDEKFANGELILKPNESDEKILELGINSSVLLNNSNSKSAVLVVEELDWSDFLLKPQHLVFFSEFKDLFAEEHLNSNVKLHLGEQALLFTDIVGSTAFYDEMGDAKAFQQVRLHFADIYKAVNEFDGEVVKTIGDAVMAVFPTIEAAYAAAVKIQKVFSKDRQDIQIRVRASIHSGVVIGVHLQSGLDFFGSTINKCAKIQSLAGAGEVVMTQEIFERLPIKQTKQIPTKDKIYGAESPHPISVKVVQIS